MNKGIVCLVDTLRDPTFIFSDCNMVYMDTETQHYPILIAGNGIAGLTAAIYAGRANNNPLVLKGNEPGGQLTLTTDVANYPGFPEGVGGTELITNMERQAEQFGASIQSGIVADIDDTVRPFCVELTNGDEYTADAIIAASGASARTLGIPGEDEYMGYGVSTCATCDGAFFRDEDVIVVGGGDAACEEADFLTKFADTVYLIHRREGFRAEAHWVDRIEEQVEAGNIELKRNTELVEIHGTDNEVTHVTTVRHPDGYPSEKQGDPQTEELTMDIGAVFVAIGHTPNTGYLEDTGVELDETGYIVTDSDGSGAGQTETAVSGIFGAGDVVDYHYQQAVTAAGMGCKASIDADEYCSE